MTANYSVVVLYYRAGAVLGATLDALLEQNPPPLEVLVVDNDSRDGVASAMTEARPSTRLLTLEHNEGYAGGMNRGAAALREDATHILFLTHEATLAAGAAAALVDAAARSGASECGPVLTRHRDGSTWSAGGTLSARGATSHLLAPSGDEPYRVDWLDGAVLLIDRAAFERIGGFDERYFLYWEDVDVSVRLRPFGPILCVPAARAAQDTGSTPPYYASRNRIVFWRSHGTPRARRRAAILELTECIHDVARRRPRLRDAVGRALGVVDGLTGRLRPTRARIRS